MTSRGQFEQVSPGQEWSPPHHAEWNAMLEIAKDPQVPRGFRDDFGPNGFGVLRALVNNSTGSDYSAGSVVAVGQPSFPSSSEAYSTHVFESSAADEETRLWGVVPFVIPDDELGEVFIGGLAYAQVDIKHASHDRVSVNPSGTLESSFHGTGVLVHQPAGTGVLDCVVSIHHRDAVELKGVADADITPGSSALVSVWRDGSDSGANVTAHLNWMHGAQKVSSGKQVLVRWFTDEQRWIVVGAECE